MTKVFALLAFSGIVQISPAQTDAELKQRVAASLPRGTSLIGFDRLPSNRAIVVTSKPDEEDLRIDASLATFGANGRIKLSKPVENTCGYGKPRILRVDVDRDGQPEVAIVCNLGGAHGLESISVVKATRTGLIDLSAGARDAYEWTVVPGSKSRPTTLIGESSTYVYTGVHDVGGPGSLFIRYSLRNGRFRIVKTRRLRRLDDIARRAGVR